MLLAGHNHHASSHSASDLVTRAGGALVVQAGTATSTRVREQEQSFNAIDVADASVTITVNALERRPLRAARRPALRWAGGQLAHRADGRAGALILSRLPRSTRAAHAASRRFRPRRLRSTRVLAEDLGTRRRRHLHATIAADARFTAEMNCRQPIVVAGLEIAAAILPRARSRTSQIEQLAQRWRPRRARRDADAPCRQCARDARRRALRAQHAPASLGHRHADAAICRRDRWHRRNPARHPQDHPRACACSRNMPRAWAARRTIACGSTTAC